MAEKANFLHVERRLFVIGLIVKVVVGALLASAYLTDLFVPFVQKFVSDPFASPYVHATFHGMPEAFPYPAGMLYLLSLPIAVLKVFGLSGPVSTLLMCRTLFLFADVVIYLSLRRFLSGDSLLRFAWLYWLSPVAFWITYIHGQLDVLPIAVLTLSMSMLFARRIALAAILFGVAVSVKTSVALVFPMYLLFLHERPDALRDSLRFVALGCLVFLIVNLPFLPEAEFRSMVFNNSEQAKVLTLSIDMGDAVFYVVPAALIAVWSLGARVGLTNRNLFIMFVGFCFCVVLLLIPPMFGWYFWIIPFFAFFFSLHLGVSPFLFLTVQAIYLLYHLVSPTSDYAQVFQIFFDTRPELGLVFGALSRAGLGAAVLHNVVFTLTQLSLLFLCFQVYRYGVRRYRIQKLTGQPFLLGVGGNSGVGKSTLSDALQDIFGVNDVTILRGDDCHKWQRGHPQWSRFTHLDPKANHLYSEISTLRRLKKGKKIWRSLYDHNTGTFTRLKSIVPKRLMVLEGLHPFFLDGQQRLFDLRVFVDPEKQLGLHWKVCRDRKKRNYTTQQVMAQIDQRRDDEARFIATQRPRADIVVTPKADREIVPLGEFEAEFALEYELTLSTAIDVEPVLDVLEDFDDLMVQHRFLDVDHQVLSLSGTCRESDIKVMQEHFNVPMHEIGILNPTWPAGLYAAVVFVIVKIIFMKAANAK